MPSRDENAIYPLLADAYLDSPSLFASSSLAVLSRFYDLIGISFYTFNRDNLALVLRGQHGFDYADYTTFELPITCLAGKAVLDDTPQVCDAVMTSCDFVNQILPRKYNLKTVVVIPLAHRKLGSTGDSSPLGVICAYPKRPEVVTELRASLLRILPFVARLYQAALDHIKIQLRQKLVHRAGYSHDLGGLVNRALQAFAEIIPIQAASLFIHDAKTGFLRLRASTTQLNQMQRRLMYFPPNSDDPTYQVFRDSKQVMLDVQPDLFTESKLFELPRNQIRNSAIVPIRDVPAPKMENPRPLGVFRAFNRELTHGKQRLVTSFGWEEVELIEFFLEMVGVMVHFMVKGDTARDDFARTLHGAANNLQAAKSNLEYVESPLQPHLPNRAEYFITDSIAFLSDILSQINRVDLCYAARLEIGEVELFGEVLSKLPLMVKRMARIYDAGIVDMFPKSMIDEGFKSLPTVRGNVDALRCVVRNLVDNAVKYSDPSRRSHSIWLSVEVQEQVLMLSIANDGVKIPADAVPYLFTPGFRTDDAIARHPSSNGFGLADCKDLMLRMDGDVCLNTNEEETTFRVKIPLWKKRN